MTSCRLPFADFMVDSTQLKLQVVQLIQGRLEKQAMTT
jgi:hypothetical protein